MWSSSTTASVRLHPDDDPLERADALVARGEAREAVILLQAMVEQGRGGLLLRSSLVRALIAAGEMAAALETARQNASLYPGVAVAAVTLGEALFAAGHLPTAIGEFQRALRLDPSFAEARLRLGEAWLAAGEAEKALEAFGAIDDAETLPHLADAIAEARAMAERARSDPGYVRHLFDQFSSDYDTRMRGQLGYGAPEILRSLADLVMPDRSRTYSIFDLGCGTGLAGLAFKDIASTLDGIDLSPAMIEKARSREIYGELRIADLESALVDEGRAYDLLLAADTFVYLGDLVKVFEGASRRLHPGGSFLFTVEKKEGDGFELGPKRRWRHSESYLRRQAARTGFEIVGFLQCHPRTEAGVPVEGYAVALRRA
jgi:predicted TPR repeat methyltransferase